MGARAGGGQGDPPRGGSRPASALTPPARASARFHPGLCTVPHRGLRTVAIPGSAPFPPRGGSRPFPPQGFPPFPRAFRRSAFRLP